MAGESQGKAKATPPAAEAAFYKYFLPFQTTLRDNDHYGHLNNAVYVQYADSTINEYLTYHCALQAVGGTTPIGLIISSNFTYLAPLEYPAPLIAALSVTSLGRTSVRYGIALFPAEAEHALQDAKVAGSYHRTYRLKSNIAAAYAEMTHVFVDPHTRRPTEIPRRTRAGLQAIVTAAPTSKL